MPTVDEIISKAKELAGVARRWTIDDVLLLVGVMRLKPPAPRRQLMDKWRSIDTAPRDATAILVMTDNASGLSSGRAEVCDGTNTVVAEWWECEGEENGEWICYMNLPAEPRCPFEPTHWMPLPHPPQAQEQADE